MRPFAPQAQAPVLAESEAVLDVDKPTAPPGTEGIFISRGVKTLVDKRQFFIRQVGNTGGYLRTNSGDRVPANQVKVIHLVCGTGI